jgi:hypothetical protein
MQIARLLLGVVVAASLPGTAIKSYGTSALK